MKGFDPRDPTEAERVKRVETPLARAHERGRGTITNAGGRFEKQQREAFDDGWHEDEALPPFRTETMMERAVSVITRNDSPDLSFDRSINPYRGCEHGCSYCYARPSHAYLGLSPGLDFESRLFAKPNAAELLERELAHPRYQPREIALGTNTDPYQPIERHYRITRQILEVLARTQHPVTIVTKNAMVLRDLDLLAPMAAKGLARVALSVTTLDGTLARKLEPRASIPARRIDALRQMSAAGIPTAILASPMIPAINDHEIEAILEAGAEAGVEEANYILIRLPLELRELFREWLLVHYPGKLRHVLSLVQSMRSGADYDSRFGTRQTGTGPYAELLAKRFRMACQRLGIKRRHSSRLRTDLFTPPVLPGAQMSLF
ncbi:MAG: PA0069 family radical SAM protein [Beijerinckiaceae bacterium]|nr:PA0069 family radical SAM protein [Beijerinckiaceae bacterium]